MAIYTTLFTAADSELTQFFPGWRFPLPTPRYKTGRIPFTGQEITLTIWDPGRTTSLDEVATLYEQRGRPILSPAMQPDGEYADFQQWLEETCPILLRTMPHLAMKAITHLELQQLGAAIVGDTVQPARFDAAPPARFVDCRKDEGCIGAIQAQAIPLLASASEQQLRDYGVAWQSRMEEADPDDDLWVLVRVRALARDAVARQANLFSHTSV